MTTLQLRLRDQDMLWEVVCEIADSIFQAMEEYRNTDTIDPMDYACIYRIVLDHLNHSVTGFDPCGDKERCHTKLTPVIPTGLEASIAQTEHSRRYEPYILLFESKEHFDRYVHEIDELIFSALSPGDVVHYWTGLKPRIEQILRFRLGKHLFENPVCENCSRCTPRSQFDPWMKTDAA